MSMKICKECGSEVSKSAKTCPKCGKKLKSGPLKIVLGIIILSVIIGAIAGGSNNTSSGNKKESNKITLEKFNKIETGMTYEQVVEIIGEEGTIISETDITGDGEYHTAMYYWYAENGISNANVTIQRGKVVSKAQIGLD